MGDTADMVEGVRKDVGILRDRVIVTAKLIEVRNAMLV